MKRALFIRQIDDMVGDARLYFAFDGFVLVSAAMVPLGESRSVHETLVFRANAEGAVTDPSEIGGIGTLSHALALAEAGYREVTLLTLHAACAAIYAALHASALAGCTDPDAHTRASKAALEALARTDEGATLLAALDAAPWAEQPDGSFVTSRYAGFPNARIRGLHAPAKQGELCTIFSSDNEQARFAFFASRADARRKRENERAAKRESHTRYETHLARAVEQLRTCGARWYRSGAFGGELAVEDFVIDEDPYDMPHVSARGALMRAWGVKCTCGRRAGHHAERLPKTPCEGCDRVNAFGDIAERFRDATKTEVIDGVGHSRMDRIWLYVDGALAEHHSEYIAWGASALADVELIAAKPVRVWTP